MDGRRRPMDQCGGGRVIGKMHERYVLGILHSIEFVAFIADLPTLAAGMRKQLLEGFTNKDILRLAKEQDVRIHDDVKKAVVE